MESNLDRPGILWHLDFQFLITSNKNLPNPAYLGIIFMLLPLLYFCFCWKGTLSGTQLNWYLFSSVICHCETQQLLFLAYHQLSAGFWMHLSFMHCGFYFCGYIKMFMQNHLSKIGIPVKNLGFWSENCPNTNSSHLQEHSGYVSQSSHSWTQIKRCIKILADWRFPYLLYSKCAYDILCQWFCLN